LATLFNLAFMESKKKNLLIRMWKFQFSFIDFRLNALAGFAVGLMLAKLWDPILSLNWYVYLIIAVAASIKPLITFIKQI
tara:strand:+ start:271 stop:510 length:240 start_codon:yes stop_codon:yes gene_type:complete